MKRPRSDFSRIGDKLGISPFRIYLAEDLAERFASGCGLKGDSSASDLSERREDLIELMQWLLLHAAVQAGGGHLRTDLFAIAGEMREWYTAEAASVPGFNPDIPELIGEAVGALRAAALKSGFWGLLGRDDASADSVAVPRPPMVLSHDRRYLYFLRRRRLEDELLEHLERRLEPAVKDVAGVSAGMAGVAAGAVPDSMAGGMLESHGFPLPADLPENPAGRLASLLAEGRKLILLSGGPGTGKTTTVGKLLELLEKGRAEAVKAASVSLKVVLAAPTGRAAARMTDGLAAAGTESPVAQTLHSLLGMRRGRVPLRNEERPLEAGLVIVDEASMVDAAMMLSLLKAMPESTPLLLVGDPDQLPSVEAGALLGDLLSVKGGRLVAVTERLTKVYRSSIAVLEAADAVRLGDSEALSAACLASGMDGIDNAGDGVRIHSLESPSAMVEIITDIYRKLVEAAKSDRFDTAILFSFMENHTVLSPLRRGAWGVTVMNNRVSAALGDTTSPFPGMPIVVTGNDSQRGLWNGDKGIIISEEGRPRACFPESDGFRTFPLAALPGWEPAWMQTIHKSQGSEFNRVTIVLPEGAERLLSREILYTAFTRARNRVDLYADPGVVDAALERGVVRHSRIREWAAGGG